MKFTVLGLIVDHLMWPTYYYINYTFFLLNVCCAFNGKKNQYINKWWDINSFSLAYSFSIFTLRNLMEDLNL